MIPLLASFTQTDIPPPIHSNLLQNYCLIFTNICLKKHEFSQAELLMLEKIIVKLKSLSNNYTSINKENIGIVQKAVSALKLIFFNENWVN